MNHDFAKYSQDLGPVLLSGVHMVDAAKEIMAHPYFEKQSGWLKKLMQQQKKNFASANVLEKKASGFISTVITSKLGLGSALVHKVLYSDSAIDAVYEPAFFMHAQGQEIISTTVFCCSEARFLLQGSDAVIGWRYDELEGESFQAKVATLNKLSAEGAIALATKIGFAASFTGQGQLLIIPAGHLVATVTHGEVTQGLRWALHTSVDAAAKKELAVVASCLSGLLDAFPSFQKGLHQDFKALVEVLA